MPSSKSTRGQRPAPPPPAGEVLRITKQERLLNLVAFLLSARTAVPFSRIRGRVAGYDDPATPEALEKRFDRDKAELRALGVPIVYDTMDEHGHEGYRIPREQYFLPQIELSLAEAAALAVVQSYARNATSDPLARPLASALRKVQVDSPLTGAAAASVTEQHVLGVRTEEAPGELSANLTELADAVLSRRVVSFRYYGIGKDAVSDRDVEPYGLAWHGRHWYLLGRDRAKAELRQFRVDRIRGRVKVRREGGFEVPDDFDAGEHVSRPAFLLDPRGGGERVSVELMPEIAFMARDARRPEWEIRDLPGGGLVVTFDANDRGAVMRFVADYAERARVVAPAAVREEARALFADVLERHDRAPTDIPGGAGAPRSRGGSR